MSFTRFLRFGAPVCVIPGTFPVITDLAKYLQIRFCESEFWIPPSRLNVIDVHTHAVFGRGSTALAASASCFQHDHAEFAPLET